MPKHFKRHIMSFKEFTVIMGANGYDYSAGVEFYMAWATELLHKAKKIQSKPDNPVKGQLLAAVIKDQQYVLNSALWVAQQEQSAGKKFFETYVPAMDKQDILDVVAAQKKIAPYLKKIGVEVEYLI
ncbi:hypothetical protein [Loigolactobacillus jiayinensis]|uniref:Uncharacterized protein n=1 Tax=Loigolactobacillus jiayinensis TaxID=2486016 RepID=A0ABW1RBY1_9LACO|nr:hypothetical protein [Loigolactobacillus jiayinensis]